MPSLSKFPIHLGLGARAVSEPEFTGLPWYAEYSRRHASDGNEARVMAMHSFSEPWAMWEMHPVGDEVVLCTAGEVTLIQELDGAEIRTTLKPGEYAINDAGVWHTADVLDSASAVFITAGIGTEHRPR